MGWHCFCAICSGPNIEVAISKWPRSAYFKRRLEATMAERKAKNIPDDEFSYMVDLDPLPGEDVPSVDFPTEPPEEHQYDRDILTMDDTKWSLTFYAIALRAYDDDIKG
jgi:hypothetical protein